MPDRINGRAIVAVLVVTVVVGYTLGGTAATSQLTVDPTPSGPSESESTHALTATVESGDAVAGSAWNDVLIDYSLDQPTADVSNVGAGTIERVGIDRGGTLPGTQVDERVTEISEVTGQKDGNAVKIALGGDRTLEAGDEVVVVISPVQNPQNAGQSDVELTINTQSGATSTTGTVTYEQHTAEATFSDQTSSGDTVTVDRVNLSEGGFVTIQNTSGASTGAIRGSSDYLSPGVHEDVTVTVDQPISSDTDLVAQAYTDSNADRTFDYVTSGGEKDGPYRNTDDNIVGSDSATVTYQESTATPTATPTATATATPTSTPTATPTATPTDTPTPTPTTTATPADTATSTATPPVSSTPTPTASGSGPTPTATATASPTPTPVPSDGATPTPSDGTDGSDGSDSEDTSDSSDDSEDMDDSDGTDNSGDTDSPDEMDDSQDDDSGTDTPGESGPGFGAVIAILALVVIAVFLQN